MTRKAPLVLTLLAIAFSFILTTRVAHALTITPIRYEISGDPGQVITKEMTLINESNKSQIFYASFANFEAQGDTGNPTFIDPKDGLGTWMSTNQASINLGPGEQKIVPFTITIPQNAEPGGHFAALFWGTSPGAVPGAVSIGTKTGVLVLLSVSGDVEESAGLLDFQTHEKKWFYKELPVGFEYRFSNQGGDRVKPAGSVIIRSILGWRVAKVNANPFDGNVLPHTTRKFTAEWAKRDSLDVRNQEETQSQKYSFFGAVKKEWHNFAVGIFRANLVAQYGTTVQTAKSNSTYFIVFPFELLLLVALVLTGVWFILRIFLRRYKRSIIRKAQQQFEKQQSV